MNTKLNRILFSAFLVSALLVCSCKKKEQAVSPPVPGNEFITTIKWHFVNVNNPADTLWARWYQDPNGTLPPDTSHAIVNLKKNATYNMSVHIYDESQNPAVDITNEIAVQRANYHLYFFFESGGLVSSTGTKHIIITATDHDTNNPPLPIGMQDKWVTDTTTCSGRVEGVLRHQPNSKNGTFAPGSSDSDVFFTVNIN
jgi:hypothetical protein